MCHVNEPERYGQGEAQTLAGVLVALEARGFAGQFGAAEGGLMRCFACGLEFPAVRADVDSLRRLEGASDPADMLAVFSLRCPECRTRGTLVLGYGPDATLDDSEVLVALPEPTRLPEPTGSIERGDRSD
jgi:hypothetical protein